jgi:hypothetical protein
MNGVVQEIENIVRDGACVGHLSFRRGTPLMTKTKSADRRPILSPNERPHLTRSASGIDGFANFTAVGVAALKQAPLPQAGARFRTLSVGTIPAKPRQITSGIGHCAGNDNGKRSL